MTAMTAMMMSALLSAALLLLLPAAQSLGHSAQEGVPFDLVVQNSLLNTPNVIYSTQGPQGGILLGGLRRLMAANSDFKFTYSDDPNYGPYLESVNGVAGSDKDHTYWELLVKTPDGETKRPDVGIGCYIPSANEEIILRFTKWK